MRGWTFQACKMSRNWGYLTKGLSGRQYVNRLHCLQTCFSKNLYPALPSGWASSFKPPDPSVSPLWFLFNRACSCKGSNSLELSFDAALFLSGTPSVTQADRCKQSNWCMKHQNLTPSLLSIFQVNSTCSEVNTLLTNRFLYSGTT